MALPGANELNEGLLPKQWKQANIKALLKKGKRTQCSNY